MLPTPATLIHSGAIPPLLGCLVPAGAFCGYRRLVRHREWPQLLGDLLVFVSLIGICALTLARNEGSPSFSGHISWAAGGLNRFIGYLGTDSEITLNIVLFVPAAATISWRYGRPLLTVVGLFCLSRAVELTQGLVGLGNADVSDVLSNLVGTLLGALLAGAVLCFTAYRTTPIALTTAGLVILLLVGVGGALPLATWREDHVRQDLQSKFTGTNLSNYSRWDAAGELPARVFRLDQSFSDGATVNADQAVVRFPADTLGLRRCVLATWTPTGFSARAQSGAPCQVFMG